MQRLALILVLTCLGAAAPAQAQSYTDPYPVESLAEVMGGLHAIAFECEGRGSQTWRAAMQELLEHEAPARGAFRDRLIQRFNEGFRDWERRRVRCGAEAEMAQAGLAERGRALSEQLRRTYLE
jgi:uncharacterized protein (TIGR02301 family)